MRRPWIEVNLTDVIVYVPREKVRYSIWEHPGKNSSPLYLIWLVCFCSKINFVETKELKKKVTAVGYYG